MITLIICINARYEIVLWRIHLEYSQSILMLRAAHIVRLIHVDAFKIYLLFEDVVKLARRIKLLIVVAIESRIEIHNLGLCLS